MQKLKKWDKIAVQFREHDEQRQPVLREIEVEKAKLEQELDELNCQAAAVNDQASGIGELEKQIEEAQKSLKRSGRENQTTR